MYIYFGWSTTPTVHNWQSESFCLREQEKCDYLSWKDWWILARHTLLQQTKEEEEEVEKENVIEFIGVTCIFLWTRKLSRNISELFLTTILPIENLYRFRFSSHQTESSCEFFYFFFSRVKYFASHISYTCWFFFLTMLEN